MISRFTFWGYSNLRGSVVSIWFDFKQDLKARQRQCFCVSSFLMLGLVSNHVQLTMNWPITAPFAPPLCELLIVVNIHEATLLKRNGSLGSDRTAPAQVSVSLISYSTCCQINECLAWGIWAAREWITFEVKARLISALVCLSFGKYHHSEQFYGVPTYTKYPEQPPLLFQAVTFADSLFGKVFAL